MFWPWRDRSESQSPQGSPRTPSGGASSDLRSSANQKSAINSSVAQKPLAKQTAKQILASGGVVKMSNGSTRELYQFREMEILLVRQPYRRRISMVHQLTGQVKVTCPKGLRDSEIDTFLEKHVEWMKTNHAQFEKIRSRNPEKKYVQDELFLFMGRQLRLHLMPGGSRGDVEIIGDRMVVYVPTMGRHSITSIGFSNEGLSATAMAPATVIAPSASGKDAARAAMVQKTVLAFYEKQGRRVLRERVKLFAQKMNLHPSSVSYRSQKTRWGSCTTRGKISLNWRLIFAPPATLDYVVIHELSHLRHHNHSAAFWNLVATQSPDFATHKRWLRDNVYAADFLAKSSEIHPES